MKIVIDLDGTLTIDSPVPYKNKKPNELIIEQLKKYQKIGFEVCIYTARNMSTYGANMGKINIHTLPVIINWLNENDVPYDEVIVGKPWCESEGFYVDDRAIRPSEFAKLNLTEIKELLDREKAVFKICS